jgi:predicted transcriptional regulator
MSQKKPDRHKPGSLVRVRKALIDQVDKLAERDAATRPEIVNRAVKEYLEREKMWPPK